MERITLISLILNTQTRAPFTPLCNPHLYPTKKGERGKKNQIWFCLSSAYYQELNPGWRRLGIKKGRGSDGLYSEQPSRLRSVNRRELKGESSRGGSCAHTHAHAHTRAQAHTHALPASCPRKKLRSFRSDRFLKFLRKVSISCLSSLS